MNKYNAEMLRYSKLLYKNIKIVIYYSSYEEEYDYADKYKTMIKYF